MNEELPLHEESVPTSEPLKTSGIPETDRKRVMIGATVGGGIFLAVLIATIVLISTEGSKKAKPKPDPTEVYPHPNPYIVETVTNQSYYYGILLRNIRHQLEVNQTYHTEFYGYTPIVRETPENLEPELLQVTILEYDEHMTRIIYTDSASPRWHVPYFGNHSDPYSQASQYTQHKSGFNFYENSNKTFEWYYDSRMVKFTPLISTHGCRLQYFDKYIEFEALLDKDYVYGMGERIESFHLKNDNYSLWNAYNPANHKSDTEPGMYGSHPFILNRLTDNQRHDFVGIFMRNSNAMLFSMWHHSSRGTTINYKIVGGVIDLFLFHTADPQYIIRKYHSVIGRPYLVPVWAMGLQQAREGYTAAEIKTVVEAYRKADIPVDAIWVDDTMNVDHRTFTVNNANFAGIKEFVDLLHDHKAGYDMHFVAMANPYLKRDPAYKYYITALEQKALIMSAAHFDNPYEGQTIAGSSVWLDFFLYNSTLIWGGGLSDLHTLVAFDGIWISENEIYNNCNGECPGSETDADPEPTGPNPFHNQSEFSYIPYRPTPNHLEYQTLPMAAYHFGDNMFHKQYFTHNLFGLQISQATYNALHGIFEDKRFLVASRSTWAGSGQYASHWLDHNHANRESMGSSIASILNFNMFGIPHVGAPIGGYHFNCTPELLVRWYELGAFYPLMLSYGSASDNRKEAYAFPEYVDIISNAIHERYSLIRFMYTKMFEAHLWGGAVVHPLFFEFTNDTEVYERSVLDATFMWANTLYIIPSLNEHRSVVKAYVPNWRWYDLRTREMLTDQSPFVDKGEYFYFDQPLGQITILIKGGSIIPYQHMSKEAKVMNTKDLELIPAQIIVAPDHENKAVGSMIVDSEGIRPYPDPTSNTYRHYTFTYMNQIFRINKLAGFDFHGHFDYDEFWEINVLNVGRAHQIDFVCMMDIYMKKKELLFVKSANSNAVTIFDHGNRRIPMYTMESIVWGSNEQHDFCKFQVHIESQTLSDNARVMTGVLATSDPSAYQLRYDFRATALNDHIVHFEVVKNEPGVSEWRVPDVVNDQFKKTPKGSRTLDAVGFGTSSLTEDFFFEMSEEYDPHDFLITSRNQPFVYVRNFIQVKFLVAGKHVFGLGERVGKFELADGIYSIWNYDNMNEENGLPPGNNMYGSHPFYMVHTHNPYDFAGVFFLTSNPMDVRVKHIGMQTEMDHILSGGILELFLIGKGSAEEVVRQYHYIIGKPHPLPFWAFGYHQSRWGYKDMDHLKLMVTRFEEENIPLDGIWMDKDFMERYKSFTIDVPKWPGLQNFIKELHTKNKHFVAIVDAGIAKDINYEVYNRGHQAEVYIKSNFTGEELVGITWAGYSVWIDYLHPAATHFWEQSLTMFYDKVDFDGLWLDMNEPSNFCDGECPDQMTYHYYFFPLDYYDDLYYNPTHRPLETRTISMEGLHYGNSVHNTEFNYHSLYGYYQGKLTSNFFIEKLKKRPFVISSATFPGSGHYVSHWLGDNYSTWTDMEFSIAGMIHFGMYGIPFTGANICGYSGNATDRLCARWMQLGAFYPFMRNHNNPSGSSQEPYVNETIKIASKKAILTRYSLVRYLYTSYMQTVLHGGMMVRPLPFLFPADNDTWTTVDTSFMIGSALRFTPILEDGKDDVSTYFPNADWYTFNAPSYHKIMSFDLNAHRGKVLQVHCGLSGDLTNIHIVAGTIFPFQDIQEGIQNVIKVHDYPINLLVVPDTYIKASGNVFYDTEHATNFATEHQDVEMHLFSSQILFSLASGKELAAYNYTDKFIDKVIILGAENFRDYKVAKYETDSGQTINMKTPNYDNSNKILILQATDSHSMDILKLKRIIWTQN